MRRDRQLTDHVVLRRPVRIREPARDAGDDGQGPQVDEDVPRVAEDEWIVRAQAVLGGDLDGGPDRALAHPNP
jgi:hypothetical protein